MIGDRPAATTQTNLKLRPGNFILLVLAAQKAGTINNIFEQHKDVRTFYLIKNKKIENLSPMTGTTGLYLIAASRVILILWLCK